MIYDKKRHEKLINEPWNIEIVQAVIKEVLNKTCQSLTDQLWSPHPSEDSQAKVNKSFYFGASGTLWGLLYLSKKQNHKITFSPDKLIKTIYQMYNEEQDTGSKAPSYFLGQLGILLLDNKISPSEKTKELIFTLIKENIKNACVDALWGCPGTMLPALFLFEETKQQRWLDLFLENVEYLFEVWKYDDASKAWYWEYRQGDKVIPFIGSGHGFFGNVFPLLKGFQYLSPEKQELLLSRTLEMTKLFAKEDGKMANWPATFFGKGHDVHMAQWCHGAPGMIQSLAPIEKNYNEELESLFLKAGELIWHAGPLEKGIGICHGTDGNGISLLKLYQRTGDKIWLERAQKFAMHSIKTRNGHYTLWTGELGFACFLQACLDEEGFFPGLDFF